jgi:hypothetical protein
MVSPCFRASSLQASPGRVRKLDISPNPVSRASVISRVTRDFIPVQRLLFLRLEFGRRNAPSYSAIQIHCGEEKCKPTLPQSIDPIIVSFVHRAELRSPFWRSYLRFWRAARPLPKTTEPPPTFLLQTPYQRAMSTSARARCLVTDSTRRSQSTLPGLR